MVQPWDQDVASSPVTRCLRSSHCFISSLSADPFTRWYGVIWRRAEDKDEEMIDRLLTIDC